VTRPLRHLPSAASAALFAWLSLSTQARAQLAFSATVESQYRFQGVSLTNGEPDGRIGVSYDHPSGVYGGVSAIIGATAGDGVRPLGFVGFLGFAKQAPSGLTWDFGITNSDITLYIPTYEIKGYVPNGGSSVSIQKYHFD
jgi:hypothetical protein